MSVWSGFGVNYKAAQSQWNADIAYFNSIGLHYIRPHMPGVPIPWSLGAVTSGSYDFWRYCAQYFHNAGFWVTWGPTIGPINNAHLTTSSWQAQHDAVVAEANYLQQQGIVIDEFEIGNEFENTIAIGISSLTQAGGLATVVTSTIHNLQTGENVTMYGASPSGYNGTFSITKTSSTSFTYSCNSSLSSPATTTGSCLSLSMTQLNANLRQLATDVKAVYSLGQVSYGAANPSINGVVAYNDWIANGLGGLDTISIHPYEVITLGNMTISNAGFGPSVSEMVTAFGSQVYISEFNLDSIAAHLAGISDAQANTWMSSLWSTITPSGVNKALIYEWNEYLSNLASDYGFAQLRPNGSMNPQWFNFFTSNPKMYPRSGPVSRSTTPSRAASPTRSAETGRSLIGG